MNINWDRTPPDTKAQQHFFTEESFKELSTECDLTEKIVNKFKELGSFHEFYWRKSSVADSRKTVNTDLYCEQSQRSSSVVQLPCHTNQKTKVQSAANAQQSNSLKDDVKSKNEVLTHHKDWHLPYPRVSWFTKSEQAFYVQQFLYFKNHKKLDDKALHKYTELMKLHQRVHLEQEEFMDYLKLVSLKFKEHYAFLPSVAQRYMQEKYEVDLSRLHTCDQFYIAFDKVPIFSNKVTSHKLCNSKTVLEMGNVPICFLTNKKNKAKTVLDYRHLTSRYPVHQKIPGKQESIWCHQVCSEDQNAEELAKKYQCDIVVSSSVLNCLVRNHSPGFKNNWDISVIIKNYNLSGPQGEFQHKVVYLNKPFYHSLKTREINSRFHKISLASKILYPHHLDSFSFNSCDEVDNSDVDVTELETFGTGQSVEKIYKKDKRKELQKKSTLPLFGNGKTTDTTEDLSTTNTLPLNQEMVNTDRIDEPSLAISPEEAVSLEIAEPFVDHFVPTRKDCPDVTATTPTDSRQSQAQLTHYFPEESTSASEDSDHSSHLVIITDDNMELDKSFNNDRCKPMSDATSRKPKCSKVPRPHQQVGNDCQFNIQSVPLPKLQIFHSSICDQQIFSDSSISVARTVSETQTPPVKVIPLPSTLPLQNTATIPLQDTVETPLQDTVETPLQDTVETPLQDTVETPLQDTPTSPLQDTPTSPLQDTAETPLQDTTETPLQDNATIPLQDTAETPLQGTTETPLQDTAMIPQQDTVETALQDTTETPLQDTATIPLQDTAETPLQGTTETPLQDTAMIPQQDTAETALQDTTETPLQDTAETPLQDTPASPLQDTAKTPLQDTAASPLQDTSTSPLQDTAETPQQDTAKTPLEDTPASPLQDTARTPLQDTTETPLQDTPASPLQDTTETPLQDTTASPLQDTTETPLQDTAETPLQDTTETPLQDTPASPLQDTTETALQDTAETPQQDTPTSPLQDTAETPLQDTTETPQQDTPTSPLQDTAETPLQDTTETPLQDTPVSPLQDTVETPQDTPASPLQDTPTSPLQDTPASPQQDTPTSPLQDTPTSPLQDTPASPLRDTPASPLRDTPARPLRDTPASPLQDTAETPLQDTPSSPLQDTPTSPLQDTPASPLQDTPSSPLRDTPASPLRDTPASLLRDTPSSPLQDTPASPQQDTPASPQQDTPASPLRDTPASPLRDTPASPLQDTPASPLRDTPASPLRDTPVSPLRDTPASPLRDTPASPLQDTPASPDSSAKSHIPSGSGIQPFLDNGLRIIPTESDGNVFVFQDVPPEQNSSPVKPQLNNVQDDPSLFSHPIRNDNISYTVWNFGELRVLIRSSYHAVKIKNKHKKNFLHLLPKLEYQSKFGYEETTQDELSKMWMSSLIRKEIPVLKVRIDAFTSEILMYETCSFQKILQKFNPIHCNTFIYNLFCKLRSLKPSRYILSHCAGETSCLISKADSSCQTVCSDLYKKYSKNLNAAHPLNVPWIPLDTQLLMPYHLANGRIPATFNPKGKRKWKNNKNNVATFSQKKRKKTKRT